MLQECQIENCVDGDGDGHPREPQAGEVCIRTEYDCDDTKPNVNPDVQEENCTSPEDDNCDDKTNCEDEQCRIALGDQCDAQCDQDNDGHYKATCGGDDCDDTDCPSWTPEDGPETWGSNPEGACSDNCDQDCDGQISCADADCAEYCIPPPPSPTPTPFDDGGGCPCGDCVNGCGGCECGDCINGCEENCGWVTVEGQCYQTSTCTEEYDPYTNTYIVTCEYDDWCDPDQDVYVCW